MTADFVLYPQNAAFVRGEARRPARLGSGRGVVWGIIFVSMLPILITPHLLALAAWTSFLPGVPLSAVDWGSLPLAVWVFGSAALITSALLVYMLWRLITLRWLATRGQVVQGELVEIEGYSNPIEKADRLDTLTVVVRYQFTSPKSGRTLQGKGRELRTDLSVRAKLPTAGTPVAVLYLNDRRYRLL